MKKLSIILISVLVALAACTKSKEVHPEIGDGNDEIVTVGMKDVHMEYTRTDHVELSRVVFHYSLAEAQQFEAAEMTKRETLFELTLNDLLSDTLYKYYYELFHTGGGTSTTEQKAFHTQAFDTPEPSEPPVVELPAVITTEASEITTNSAICGGEVTNDGGATVTERGICWSINANPTISDSHVAAGTGTGLFSATMSGLQASTTYHVRAYAINEAGTAYGLDREFVTLSGSGVGEHEWIDLGLPSGLLWATCNVGANAPEEYGDYFAWGETQTKDFYDWNTYRYCYDGNYKQLTKYCRNPNYGYNGFTDNLTILEPADDAATINWGGGARMPTKDEMLELINNCTQVWTTQNGVNGRRFIGPNGNSIFLPAAGGCGSSGFYYVGSSGHYWSSSLYEFGSSVAWLLAFDSSCVMNGGGRANGRSVRPVYSPRKK